MHPVLSQMKANFPIQKPKIKEAIVAGLRITDDEQMKDHLKSGYLQLSMYYELSIEE